MKAISIISIIDDDLVYQYVTKNSIKASGYAKEILQLYDGEQAIEYFKTHQKEVEVLPDLVFLDINMPYLDGWQFLDQLNELDLAKKEVTIYLVTSSVSSLDREKAATYEQISGYHIKPITKDMFIEIVSTFDYN